MTKPSSNVCEPIQIEKQWRKSRKVSQKVSISKILELFHINLKGPIDVKRIGGKRYIFVCVVYYSRFIWVDF